MSADETEPGADERASDDPARETDWATTRRLTQKYGSRSPVDWDEADNEAYWDAMKRLFPNLRI